MSVGFGSNFLLAARGCAWSGLAETLTGLGGYAFQVFDAEKGGLLRTYHDVTTAEVTGIDVSPDGRKLIVADSAGGISVSDLLQIVVRKCARVFGMKGGGMWPSVAWTAAEVCVCIRGCVPLVLFFLLCGA
jgi:hypothetical protein